METSDIAAAALKPDGRGKCGCSRTTKTFKPSKKCDKCHGSGTLTACLDCGGAGWDTKNKQKCGTCSGRGYLQAVNKSPA